MKMTSTKRFAVRTVLITGTTLATIIGAQALASLDETAFSKTPPAIVAPAELSLQSTNGTAVLPSVSQAPAVAPDIVILRHAEQVPSVSSAASQTNVNPVHPQTVVIQPPNPVQVVAPQPVAQQSAPVARTRSSR